jgi:hypothetical protein
MLICAAIAPGMAAAAEPGLSQDLKKLRVPAKVDAVLWTRRNDTYTLQVVFSRTSAISFMAQVPRVQVWLLRANGTVIGSKRLLQVGGQSNPIEISYSYSMDAALDAVAVAIMVDDQYSIESLAPPPSGKI